MEGTERRSAILESKDEALQEKRSAWREKYLLNLVKAGLDIEKVWEIKHCIAYYLSRISARFYTESLFLSNVGFE